MALTTNIDLGNGVTVSYHKISNIEVDYIRGDTNITLLCYVSQDIRQQDTDFSKYVKTYQTNSAGTPDTPDPRTWGYTQVLLKPDFSNAKEA